MNLSKKNNINQKKQQTKNVKSVKANFLNTHFPHLAGVVFSKAENAVEIICLYKQTVSEFSHYEDHFENMQNLHCPAFRLSYAQIRFKAQRKEVHN